MGLPSDANSTMTVKTNDATKYGGTAAPGAPPDLTDDAIRKARAAELMRLMATRGRRSTFGVGDVGDVGAAKSMAFGSFSATGNGSGKVGGY
jgi:hypothetical protein